MWCRSVLFPLYLFLVFLPPLPLFAAPLPKLVREKNYKSDHLIVKYKPDADLARLDPVARETKGQGKAMRRFSSSGAILYKLPPGDDVDAIIDRIKADPRVAYAERDHYLHIHAPVIPDDPYFEDCWGLNNTGQSLGTIDCDIDAPEAWEYAAALRAGGTAPATIIVGVVDTGVDYYHEDLHDNMWTNAGEIPDNGIDDDGNGIVDDYYGICASDGEVTGDPMDDHSHGSHCAGVIGAVANNQRGITGIAWDVRIMALKFLGADGSGLESDAAACIDYAVAHGARVLSNSYGGTDHSQTLYDAISAARDAGVLFVVSSGNETMDIDAFPSYPAAYDQDNIVTVLSTGGSDNFSYFSNYGIVSVDVGAPGEDIFSTIPGDYGLMSGTSMACPHVSGIAALVLAYHPSLSMQDLRERILWTGEPSFDLEETTSTGLRVNAFNALAGRYSVRITTVPPLPDGEVGAPYDASFACKGFAPPYAWSWDTPPYMEREVENRYHAVGAAKGWNADEGMWPLPLPFTFPFYGEGQTHLYVCSNGYVQFAPPGAPPIPTYESDETTLAARKMIAVYWSDLTTDSLFGAGADIFVEQDASHVTIRWQAQEAEWLLGFDINVSLTLHADGRLEMNYGPANYSLVGGVTGISNGDGVNYRISRKKTNQMDLAWAPTSEWVAGELPPGIALSSAGVLSGAPTTAGDYDFDVRVEDNTGGTNTKPFGIQALPEGLRADFSATPRQSPKPLTVTFTDSSQGDNGIGSWLWNFGDGSGSAQQNPVHQYTLAGNFTVSLTITDALDPEKRVTRTRLRYIQVTERGPIVDFSADPLFGAAPLHVTFTDLTTRSDPGDWMTEPLYWVWDFGDGDGEYLFEPQPTVGHTYTAAGTYTVGLTVADGYGESANVKLSFIVVTGAPGVTTTTTTTVSTTTSSTTTSATVPTTTTTTTPPPTTTTSSTTTSTIITTTSTTTTTMPSTTTSTTAGTTSTTSTMASTTSTSTATSSTTTTTLPWEITVIFPSEAGIQIERGSKCVIQWSAPTVSAKAKLKVELIDSHGGVWALSTKASNKKGVLKWKVGKWKVKAGPVYPNAADYKVRISTLDNGATGQSRNDFAIASVVALNVTGPESLAGEQAAQYACTGIYDFGPARDVTTEVEWGFVNVADGKKGPGKIGKTGLLMTKPLLSDVNCNVTAAYGKGKPPATGAIEITVTP